jgi:glucosamine--fructose-6-phosphate aminotransferase (isomerizing)
MSRLLADIDKEPQQLLQCLAHAGREGKAALLQAAELLRTSAHIYLVGMGSSWHAGMAAQAFFHRHGHPSHLAEASELLYFAKIPPDSSVILLSRSGKSIEIVRLIDKCRSARSKIVGITNTVESPLGAEADVVLQLAADFDHLVSISMYSTLAMTAAILACETMAIWSESLRVGLVDAIEEARLRLPRWKTLIDSSSWLEPGMTTYFLARGASLASAYEARLLWEEAGKAPASVLPTGGFRHGPQEVLRPGLRVCLWIDSETMRDADLTLSRDLRKQGAKVLVIGKNLEPDDGDLGIALPSIPAGWQFLIDILPVQLAAERFAQLRGEDCDSFRLCSYIVETEGGLKTVA